MNPCRTRLWQRTERISMSFGKDSSFVFFMQDGKLVNIGRSDNTADKQPFGDVEEEVWRIFGEHKQLETENKRLREILENTTSLILTAPKVTNEMKQIYSLLIKALQ